MKTIASVQARVGSERLPGKVLKNINGKPLLWYLIQRIRQSRLLDDVIVATTENQIDDQIVKFCETYGVNFYRGSENDVLDRISSMIKEKSIDVHVEFFGDSPLIDPHIIDEVIGYYFKYKDNYDFVTNSLKITYPPGQEVSVYRGECLVEANEFTPLNDPLREHVNIHITKYPDKFKIKNLEAPRYYHYPNIYLEVDTPEDFEMISTIINHFVNIGNINFTLAQILNYLSINNSLAETNNKVIRKWKEFKKN